MSQTGPCDITRFCQKWRFPEIGVPRILIGFSNVNHLFWGTRIYGNPQISKRFQKDSDVSMMFSSIQTYPKLSWNMGLPHHLHMWTMWCGSVWCMIQTHQPCDYSDLSSLGRVCNMKLFQFHQFDGHVLGKTHEDPMHQWPLCEPWLCPGVCGSFSRDVCLAWAQMTDGLVRASDSDWGESEALSQLWKPQMVS